MEKNTSSIDELRQVAVNAIEAYQNTQIYGKNRFADHVYECFAQPKGTDKYDREEIYQYLMLCQELMALLTNPKVSTLLPEFWQPIAGGMLFNMMRFFDYIEDPACQIEYDLFEAKNATDTEDLHYFINIYQKKMAEKLQKTA